MMNTKPFVKSLTRRKFIIAFLALGGGLGGGLVFKNFQQTRTDQRRTALLRMANHFSKFARSNIIGAEYLKIRPQENTLDTLVASILPDETQPNEAVFSRRVKQDFAQGRTVHVTGWVLSETEARLFALSALVSGGQIS